MVDFIRDIEPPAVQLDFLDPVFGHVQQKRFYFRIRRVEFGHIRVETEGIVCRNPVHNLKRKGLDMKPVGIP
ncbi:hypothetical protein D3C71_1674560 [compost metagenome]